MGLSEHDRKILWAKAGNRCSYRYGHDICDEELVLLDNREDVLVGEECHIVGEKLGSARYIADFSERDTYSNRILLCRKHHKVIDDNERTYTIKKLRTMKKEREKSISERIERKEIKPIVIKDSVFRTVVKNADEAIGMEVNEPAQLSNVKSELIADNVRKATGFSTNQGLTSIITTCSNCNRTFPLACTGPPPSRAICPHCEKENIIDTR
ncbi:MAG TPA: hypothetical protein ENI13_01265 [candidate division CPR3 bacterium]|uniref:HNH endonuclease n=1 Tax=candidate division CPR3 bacterium TaxID=2268181 RepID=A0A7C1NPN6_UNCC3|nr:hypothetical protein [candidate division CPR3 bacterium]